MIGERVLGFKIEPQIELQLVEVFRYSISQCSFIHSTLNLFPLYPNFSKLSLNINLIAFLPILVLKYNSRFMASSLKR